MATHPCPCGHFGNPARKCSCTRSRLLRYRAKISGPLMDRMDIQVEVPQVSYGELAGGQPEESSVYIRERVEAARQIQVRRFRKDKIFCNAGMGASQLKIHCTLKPDVGQTLKKAMDHLKFSARSYTSILKVARTIADLAGEPNILRSHILEAIQYKSLDRGGEGMG